MSGNLHDDPAPDDTVESAAGGDENFLARWSRRKSTARQTDAITESAADPVSAQATNAAAREFAETAETRPVPPEEECGELPNAQVDSTLELPPLDSLDEHSDYSAFLLPGVAADVQQQALQKLFHSPKFNVRDGLDDYDLDFSTYEPLGDVVTAEMRRRILRELERLADLDEDADAAEEIPVAATNETDEREDPAEPEDAGGADDDRSEPV